MNFSHMRNRLLFATRNDPPILGIHKTSEEVRNCTGKTRGSYGKSKVTAPATDEYSVSEPALTAPSDIVEGGAENV